jgi:hypothetical protein
MTMGDISDYLGYTSPRLASKFTSDTMRFPWDTITDPSFVPEPKQDYVCSPHKDMLLERLADELTLCSEKNDCGICPSRDRCDGFWDKVSERGSHGRLTQELYDKYKTNFEDKIKPK